DDVVLVFAAGPHDHVDAVGIDAVEAQPRRAHRHVAWVQLRGGPALLDDAELRRDHGFGPTAGCGDLRRRLAALGQVHGGARQSDGSAHGGLRHGPGRDFCAGAM
ncbi:MAG: hypothetical protein ACK559_07380, partial [bacterium]